MSYVLYIAFNVDHIVKKMKNINVFFNTKNSV